MILIVSTSKVVEKKKKKDVILLLYIHHYDLISFKEYIVQTQPAKLHYLLVHWNKRVMAEIISGTNHELNSVWLDNALIHHNRWSHITSISCTR